MKKIFLSNLARFCCLILTGALVAVRKSYSYSKVHQRKQDKRLEPHWCGTACLHADRTVSCLYYKYTLTRYYLLVDCGV
jgi:hypothetical protein